MQPARSIGATPLVNTNPLEFKGSKSKSAIDHAFLGTPPANSHTGGPPSPTPAKPQSVFSRLQSWADPNRFKRARALDAAPVAPSQPICSLAEAVRKRDVSALNELLTDFMPNEIEDGQAEAPLLQAARQGFLTGMRVLYERGASPAPVLDAVASGDLSTVAVTALRKAGVSRQLLEHYLLEAIARDNATGVRHLVQGGGIDPSVGTKDSTVFPWTKEVLRHYTCIPVLYMAVQEGKDQAAAELVKLGSKPYYTHGMVGEILPLAVERRLFATTRAIVEAGRDFDFSVIAKAVRAKDKKTAMFLLEHCQQSRGKKLWKKGQLVELVRLSQEAQGLGDVTRAAHLLNNLFATRDASTAEACRQRLGQLFPQP